MTSLSKQNVIVQFHDETASVNSSGTPTYTEVYMVITPKGTRASDIHKESETIGLPTYKSNLNNIPVSSINIDRWTEGHLKYVPNKTNFPTPAAVWKYTVIYSNGSSSRNNTNKTKAPWDLDYAQNCSLSPKEYTERVCTTLRVTSNSGTALPYVEQNKKVLLNAVGELVYRDALATNQILSFDYAVKKYDIDRNHLYLGSVNVSEIQVAGIKIASGKGKLISLVPSTQIWENDTEYTQVHVEIELAVYKSVFKDHILGNSRYAVPVTDSGSPDGTKAYPIQMLSCSVSDINEYTGVKWFNKERKLGYFGEAKKGKNALNPALYNYVTEEYPLKKDGTLYIGTKNKNGNYFLDMNDPTLDKIEVTDSYILSWANLGFPTKGFKDIVN